MEQEKDFYTQEEIEDEFIGRRGTPGREAYERALDEEVRAYQIGRAVKEARGRLHLTQAELGARAGVQRSCVSRLERGLGTSLAAAARVFRALGVPGASLDFGAEGKFALW